MIQVTAVQMAGGTRHEHIAEVRWRNPDTNNTGATSRQGMVDWLRADNENQAFVSDGSHRIRVHVVNASPPYIQTYADGVWTDNLLALPRY